MALSAGFGRGVSAEAARRRLPVLLCVMAAAAGRHERGSGRLAPADDCSADARSSPSSALDVSSAARGGPVVLASSGLEALAASLRKKFQAEAEDAPVVDWDYFKSGDPNIRFNFHRVVGRHVVFLFDSVDRGRLFEQLSLIQDLQGFPVPDGEDAGTKWKTYVKTGSYSWGRAAKITVVIPWYRPCQMERTSRWQKTEGTWTNGDAEGPWLDVPSAQTLARLIAAPAPVPLGKGPSAALDGRPLWPLWVPPVELFFLELHEEEPVRTAVEALGPSRAVRTERFVPYFLNTFSARPEYKGAASTYVLFPDHGAYDRYSGAVFQKLGLAEDHVLWIKKTRVGGDVEQVKKLFYDQGQGEGQPGEKERFGADDEVLVIDDFTNSGSTLFGAVDLVRSKAPDSSEGLAVSIFVSHLVGAYSGEVVAKLNTTLQGLGPRCRFFTTNTIPSTTDLLLQEPQVTVLSIADFLADHL